MAVAAVGIPLAAALVYFGGWALTAALVLFGAVAAWEYFRLASARGLEVFPWIGVPATAALLLSTGWFRAYQTFAPWAFGITLVVLLVTLISAIWLRWPEGHPLADAAATVAGPLYIGGCLAFAVFLRHLPETAAAPSSTLSPLGPILLAFPVVITWIGDSAAYFVGKRFGRRKLLPAVSPGKTVEGGVASIVASMVAGALAGWLVLGFDPRIAVSILLGAVMGLFLAGGAQVGDLAESVLKREAGVKDSGGIFPGHGGVLDRFDALLLNLPLAYVLLRLVEWLP
jgi:phosphatidate cytidylyltransferase